MEAADLAQDGECELTSREQSLLAQHESLCESLTPLLSALPGGRPPSTLLTVAEQAELREVQSHAAKLRRRLPRAVSA
jgi:hypothetical protein